MMDLLRAVIDDFKHLYGWVRFALLVYVNMWMWHHGLYLDVWPFCVFNVTFTCLLSFYGVLEKYQK